MAKYVSLRATAQRLIQKNGRTLIYRQKNAKLKDINNPQLGTTGFTDTSLKGAFLNDTRQLRASAFEPDRTSISRETKICLIAADDLGSIIPSTLDTIIDKTIEYNITDFEPIDPSDAPIAYQFVLRT